MKIHLGCGVRYIDGWQNIDWSDKYKVDHKLNIGTQPLPFEDGVASEVISSHLIEHLTRWEGIYHLNEIYGVLGEGGELLLSFPDLAKIVQCYHGKRPSPFNITGDDTWLVRAIFETQIDETIVHKYGYTDKTMRSLLKTVGFKDVEEIKEHVEIDGHRVCHYSFATTIFKATK